MLSRITTKIVKAFCTKNIQSAQSSSIVEGSSSSEVPVHLRPYDKAKYEVIMDKIKLNSGYAFLEIEPFPRAKIMKTCYHIMEQLSIGFPENCIYRIYNEERTKYIMKIVDETTDVQELQECFGVQVIEMFIDNLVGQLSVIEVMRHQKIWLKQNDDSFDPKYLKDVAPKKDPKYPAYNKPERPKASFVE